MSKPTADVTPSDRPTALDLGPQAALTPALAAYFAKCKEKLGYVPNVLRAYAFDAAKLQAFIDMADDLMLADSGLDKAEREMIAVAVSAVNHCHYCLTAHGAALRQRAEGPGPRRDDRAELPRSRVAAAPEGDARFRGQADRAARQDRGSRPRSAAQGGFTDRDIWDIAAVTGVLQYVEPDRGGDRDAAEPGVSPYQGSRRRFAESSARAAQDCATR